MQPNFKVIIITGNATKAAKSTRVALIANNFKAVRVTRQDLLCMMDDRLVHAEVTEHSECLIAEDQNLVSGDINCYTSGELLKVNQMLRRPYYLEPPLLIVLQDKFDFEGLKSETDSIVLQIDKKKKTWPRVDPFAELDLKGFLILTAAWLFMYLGMCCVCVKADNKNADLPARIVAFSYTVISGLATAYFSFRAIDYKQPKK